MAIMADCKEEPILKRVIGELLEIDAYLKEVRIEMSNGSVFSGQGQNVAEQLAVKNSMLNYWLICSHMDQSVIHLERGIAKGEIPDLQGIDTTSGVSGYFNNHEFLWVQNVLIIDGTVKQRDVEIRESLRLLVAL